MADDLNWLLSRLVEKVPSARSAVLLSADGIAKNWHGLARDDADQLAALASGMCSLAKQVGTRFGDGDDGVRQVVTELGEVILFVTAAGAGSVLAVLAGRDVNANSLSYEMGRLGTQIPSHLSTPARQPVAQQGNW
ncbi:MULTISPECIES: roadblock/LC7 domain-containing protein [Amycolatopsis]|uniref:Predicted regulator of Ras-like GTPase activity, Roadblock/LC7/MglB family n=2 Tax=Amycolatopsis TaxID=1813 RepID=A0A1I3YIY0_9PSEU|nr:roadblock/LC7 domain-containing protein [Amycolatopsis sacchari]SFK31723.1 Predicted regulator of Ras-like GTPase activity, Roadblock/LC7/MglB family [Amycolatopsis sacchari]